MKNKTSTKLSDPIRNETLYAPQEITTQGSMLQLKTMRDMKDLIDQ